MILIACADDRLGMTFNKRRQSRDRAVCEDIAKLAAGSAIGMDERSRILFEGMDINIVTGEGAEMCEYYFIEFEPPKPYAAKAEKIVLYRWNRHYAADMYFDVLTDEFKYAGAVQFPGTSHEKITREVYNHER